jgi:hypothetical protein
VTIATTLAAGTAAAGPAEAGTYTMNACNVPGAPTGTRGPWTIETNANPYAASNLHAYDACAAGGSFGHYLPSGAMGAGALGSVDLTRGDAAIKVTRVRAWFAGQLGSGAGSPASTLLWNDGSLIASFPDPGVQRLPYVSAAAMETSFRLATSCGNTAGQPCYLHAYPLAIYGIEVTLAETALPEVSIAGGTLTAPGPKSGTHTVIVNAGDEQSGVQKLEATLDDKVVSAVDYTRDWTRPIEDQKAGTCRVAHWNACPTTQNHTFSFSTRFVPDGTYTFAVRATDAAGNVRISSTRAVTIDNVPDPAPPATPSTPPAPAAIATVAASGATGAPGAAGAGGPFGSAGPAGPGAPPAGTPGLVANGTNGSASASITAAFAAHRRVSIRSARGRKVVITGRLIAPGGAPVSGARVQVLHKDRLLGAGMVPAGEVVTDAAGRFVHVTTAVRSRTLRFSYRAHLAHATVADSTDVTLSVAAKVTLRRSRAALRNGQAVTFSGAVEGAPRNARKVVELQVKKGRRWMTFRSTRLRNGRFSEPYRFVNTRSRQTYVFRVRVRQESGFPFATGVSRAVKVTVRG